jgi:hypothetical protein
MLNRRNYPDSRQLVIVQALVQNKREQAAAAVKSRFQNS